MEDTSLPHVRGSQGVSQGLRIYQVRPIYPTRGLQDRIQGTVVLRAHISKKGNVQDLKLVSGHPGSGSDRSRQAIEVQAIFPEW